MGDVTVLVTGGTGQIGWGAARAVQARGGRLVLPSRSDRGVAELAASFPGATAVQADVGDPEDSSKIVDAIGDHLDHVVAPIGSWWSGKDVLSEPRRELDDLLHTYVSAQHQLLSTTNPLLRRSGGSYTMVSGAAGEEVTDGPGLLVIAVRAQFAFSEVLRHELQDAEFRFNEFRISTRVERKGRDGVVPAEEVGDEFVRVMSSDRRSELIRYP